MRPLATSASQTRALWLLAVLAAVAFVKLAADLLIPIVLSLLVALALEPIVGWLVRRRVPRGAAAALVVALLVGSAGWAGYTLRDNVTAAVEAMPAAARRVREMLEATLQSSRLDQASQELRGDAPGRGTAAAAPSDVGPAAQRVGQSVLAALGEFTVIVFFVFFLLQSGPRMAARVVEAAGTPSRRALVATILTDVNAQVQRFLLVQAFTATVVAVVTWLVLAWLGMAYAAMWGVLAGVFNSIPYFGPILRLGRHVPRRTGPRRRRERSVADGRGDAAHHVARRLAADPAAHGPRRAHERPQRLRRTAGVDLAVGRLGHTARRADALSGQVGGRPRRSASSGSAACWRRRPQHPGVTVCGRRR